MYIYLYLYIYIFIDTHIHGKILFNLPGPWVGTRLSWNTRSGLSEDIKKAIVRIPIGSHTDFKDWSDWSLMAGRPGTPWGKFLQFTVFPTTNLKTNLRWWFLGMRFLKPGRQFPFFFFRHGYRCQNPAMLDHLEERQRFGAQITKSPCGAQILQVSITW